MDGAVRQEGQFDILGGNIVLPFGRTFDGLYLVDETLDGEELGANASRALERRPLLMTGVLGDFELGLDVDDVEGGDRGVGPSWGRGRLVGHTGGVGETGIAGHGSHGTTS